MVKRGANLLDEINEEALILPPPWPPPGGDPKRRQESTEAGCRYPGPPGAPPGAGEALRRLRAARPAGSGAEGEEGLVREAWRAVLEAAARFEAAEVVEVVGLARSVDEVEQAASVAARWVHARDPGEGQRQAVAYALRAKVIVLPVDAFAVASALLVEPSAELWETLHRRTPRLTPLLFDVLHREVARRPAVFLESIQTARVPALWKEHIERVAGLPGEPCRCPDCRYKDADCGEFAGGAELERGPGR